MRIVADRGQATWRLGAGCEERRQDRSRESLAPEDLWGWQGVKGAWVVEFVILKWSQPRTVP